MELHRKEQTYPGRSRTIGMPAADGPSDAADADVDFSLVAAYDTDDRPSMAVVEAVADVTDTDAIDLPPLYEVVDPDAVDALFDHARRDGRLREQRLSFAYAGFDVTLSADGSIELSPR